MSNAGFHSVVYGPIKSRRLGPSLGVNPVPSTREECEASCIYCQLGTADGVPILSRTNQLPSAGVIVTSAARKLIEMSRAGEKLETVMLAGNGDPTKHPALLEISENLRDLRNKWFAKADLVLLSDSTNLGTDEVRRALRVFDRPILRFEWGSAKTYTTMTGRSSADYKTVCDALTGVDRLVIQAEFGAQNSSDVDLRGWLKKLEELRPKEVHLLAPETSSKKAAKSKSATPTKLEELAAQVTEKTGAPATVFALEAIAA